jgi:hypothetical protein
MPTDDKALKYAYAIEKFGCALEAMARAPGGPQDGLHDAWMCFHPVRPDDLPAGELRALFVRIRDDLTCEEPVGNEGTLAATLRKMSDKKAYQLIERIMEFNRKLRGLDVTRRVFVDPMPNEGRSSVH